MHLGKTIAAAALAASLTIPTGAAGGAPAAPPNILFVILDDVGVDQMKSFGFGGANPPDTANMDLIAAAGIKFTNVWGMPECSSSRAAYFTGRYPSRTGVGQAILGNHLPQSYMSPFETTLPRILRGAGYESAMVGKYHLGDEKDPAGACAPSTRGFDAFIGTMDPGPPSIDKTAGGIDPAGTQACGYVQTDDPAPATRRSATAPSPAPRSTGRTTRRAPAPRAAACSGAGCSRRISPAPTPGPPV